MDHEHIARADDNDRRLSDLKRNLMGNVSKYLSTMHGQSFEQEQNRAKYCSGV
jgi:hypothetical protein